MKVCIHMSSIESPPSLGVMMPAYNEAATLEAIAWHVLRSPLVAQLVIVDDGSTDGSPSIIAKIASQDRRVVAVRHERNRGKGAALRTAIYHVSTEFAIVQDADLEYDPADYAALMEPVLTERTDVVFGVRGFLGHTAHSYWFVLGNRLVTFLTNVLFNRYIADMETGYKLMRIGLWRRLNLQGDRFDVEPQITARVIRLGYQIHEVPIHYYARSRAEGKKLSWRDGVKALAVLLRLRFASQSSLFGKEGDQYHVQRRLHLSQQHPLKRTEGGEEPALEQESVRPLARAVTAFRGNDD
jgi:glycosyltransferase involved in cell wall biosynthesis